MLYIQISYDNKYFWKYGSNRTNNLKLIKDNFPSIKATTNTNLKLLLNQINTFKPKYIY